MYYNISQYPSASYFQESSVYLKSWSGYLPFLVYSTLSVLFYYEYFCEWTVENCLYKLIVNLLPIVLWLNLFQQNN